MRMSRGILTSVMMKDPLATVPRWYRTSLRTEDRIGVTGSRFLSLEDKDFKKGLEQILVWSIFGTGFYRAPDG